MAERVENKEKELILNNFWASVCGVCVCAGLIAVVPAGWQRRRSSPANSTHTQLPGSLEFSHGRSHLFFSFLFFHFYCQLFYLEKKTDKQTKLFFYFLLTWIYFVLISLSFSLGQMSFTSYLI